MGKILATDNIIYLYMLDCNNRIKKVIQQNSICTMFQPIISIKEKRIIGFEALCRGIDTNTKEIISPLEMFAVAQRLDMNLDLDRKCRKKAVENFNLLEAEKNQILFLNFDPSILEKVIIGSRWMANLIHSNNMNPGRVAIEIVESKLEYQKDLIKFTKLYRKLGFIIVLDDFGAEHSNLDRILLVKPDIIKIDRKLIHDINKDYYKQAIVSSIIEMAGKTGSLCLAEGVEQFEDVCKCYEIGIELFQGFYFAKPLPIRNDFFITLPEKIKNSAIKVGDYINSVIDNSEKQKSIYKSITDLICDKLKNICTDQIDNILYEYIQGHNEIQCAYLINSSGQQISSTICNLNALFKRRHALFCPQEKGADHSLKVYFYNIKNLNIDYFLTDSYISIATGTLCRTMSMSIEFANREPCILCVDFDADYEIAYDFKKVI